MFSSPIAILYGVILIPIFEIYSNILSLVRKEHIISPPKYKYLCLPHSSPILSNLAFESITNLSKALDINVLSHISLLPKKIFPNVLYTIY